MSATARQPRVPRVAAAPDPAPIVEPAGTPSLDAMVLEVMTEAQKLTRNAAGQVGSRSYKYVTLTAVVDEVLPLLAARDLLWKTFPTMLEDGRPGLRYRMSHITSGEFDEDTMPLLCDPTMQGLGSGITYARRYALTSYLGLTVDEDDDGYSANTPVRTISAMPDPDATLGDLVGTASGTPAPAARPAQGGGTRPVSVAQGRMLHAKARAARLSQGQFADVLLVATGHEARQMDEPTASRWLKMGVERFPANAVDKAVAAIEGGAA